MAYEPTVTAFEPPNGVPGVKVVFTGFAAGTVAVNVWRYAAGRQMLVRGGSAASVAGAGGFFDAEAPFGISSTYFAEMFDSDGVSLGKTGTASIQVDSDRTWLHNPLHPQGGLPVRTGAGTGATVTANPDVAVFYPTGRRAGIAVTGPRRGISQAAVQVWTDTLADADGLDAMFGSIDGGVGLPSIVCVRLASTFVNRLPRPLFLAVPTPTQTPVSQVAGGTRILWDLTGAEVDPPAPSIAEAVLSHGDLDAYYSTRQARDATYNSRLAMDTDYNLAGYAADGGQATSAATGWGAGTYGAGVYGDVPVTLAGTSSDGTSTVTPSATSNSDGTAVLTGGTDNGDGTATF